MEISASNPELGEAHEDPSAPEQSIPETWENKYSAQLVWNPLDWLGTRLKYQKINRGAHINLTTGVNPLNPADANAVLDNNNQAFYAARAGRSGNLSAERKKPAHRARCHSIRRPFRGPYPRPDTTAPKAKAKA